MTQLFPTFNRISKAIPRVGRAIVFSPIYIIKYTWKWIIAIILLFAVAHSIAIVVLGRQVENEIARIKAAGDPVTCAELAGKPIPDTENGAVIYEKAFKYLYNLKKLNDYDNRTYYADILITKNRSNPKAWERARKAIKENNDIFLLTKEAIAKPQCRFNINWGDSPNLQFPFYAKIRNLANFLATRALINARDGKTDQALESINMIYSISDSIKDEPILIAVLVRTAILSIADNALQYTAENNQINESQAKTLASKMSLIDLRPELITAGFKADRAIGLDIFDGVKKRGNKYLQVIGFKEQPFALKLEMTYLGRPLLYLDEACYLKKINKVIDRSIHYTYHNTENLVDSNKTLNKYYVFTNTLLPLFEGADEKLVFTQTQLDGGQILLALCAYKNKFGSYPATLVELKDKTSFKIPSEDPFSGKDFIYKRQRNGFLLYSIGEDMKDSGGVKTKWTHINNKYADDIAWKMSH